MSSLSLYAGVLVEDVTGNGGYFGWRDVLEFPVAAAAETTDGVLGKYRVFTERYVRLSRICWSNPL